MIVVLSVVGLVLAGILYLDRKSLKAQVQAAEASVLQKLLDGERDIKLKLENLLSEVVTDVKAGVANLEGSTRVEVLRAVDYIKAEIKSKL